MIDSKTHDNLHQGVDCPSTLVGFTIASRKSIQVAERMITQLGESRLEAEQVVPRYPVIAWSRPVLAAVFADFIFTAGSPSLLASRAHEEHTTILSRTTPASSVVTRYGFRFVM
jgi:hypothetical protein